MAVAPKQVKDVFGNDDWLPAGPVVALTAKNWEDVAKSIVNALTGPAPTTPVHSPFVALRVTFPPADGSPTAQYVILMRFNEKSMDLYRDGKQIGTHPIQDNDDWAAILNSFGASPAPKTPSSN